MPPKRKLGEDDAVAEVAFIDVAMRANKKHDPGRAVAEESDPFAPYPGAIIRWRVEADWDGWPISARFKGHAPGPEDFSVGVQMPITFTTTHFQNRVNAARAAEGISEMAAHLRAQGHCYLPRESDVDELEMCVPADLPQWGALQACVWAATPRDFLDVLIDKIVDYLAYKTLPLYSVVSLPRWPGTGDGHRPRNFRKFNPAKSDGGPSPSWHSSLPIQPTRSGEWHNTPELGVVVGNENGCHQVLYCDTLHVHRWIMLEYADTIGFRPLVCHLVNVGTLQTNL